MGAVAHGLQRIGLHVAVAGLVAADATADLDDRDLLVAVADDMLSSRWWFWHEVSHAFLIAGSSLLLPVSVSNGLAVMVIVLARRWGCDRMMKQRPQQ